MTEQAENDKVLNPEPRIRRVTFEIPADLHKRIRMTCFEKEVEMKTEFVRILQEHFPAPKIEE